MSIRSLISVVYLCLTLAVSPASADSTIRGSQGSTDFSAASATIVNGSTQIFAGSSQLLVSSVEIVGDSVVVVLRGASEATQVSLKLSGEVVGAASLAVGTSVQVIAESTGYLLTTAGKAIAFIPNELGRSLLHHSRYRQRG